MHARRSVAFGAIVTSLALVSALTGCASSAGNATKLASAKSRAIAAEQQIAAFVPSSSVLSTTVTKKSKVIYPCLGKSDQSYWPGTLNLNLKSGVDTDAVLTAIAAHWTNKSGWSVFKSTGSDGNAELEMKSSAGNFTVEFVDGPAFTITTLSACFPNSGLTGMSSY